MLSKAQELLLGFLKAKRVAKFVEIFPWAAVRGVEHPDVVAKSLADLGLITVDYSLGVYCLA